MKNKTRLLLVGGLCAVTLLGWLVWQTKAQPVVFSPSAASSSGGGGVAGVSTFNLRAGAVTLTKGDVTALGTLDNNTAGNAATATGSEDATFRVQSKSGGAPALEFYSLGGADDWPLILNNHSNLLTGLSFVARNYVITPVSVPYSASVALNFNAAGNQWIQLEGDITITSLNVYPGRGVTVRFDAGAADRTINLPAWRFLAGTRAITLSANKAGILSVIAYDTSDGNCIATWASE